MPRKGDFKPWPDLGPRDGSEGLSNAVRQYLAWMKSTGYSPNTIAGRTKTLRMFLAWCAERDIARPEDVTFAVLERYQQAVSRHRKRDGYPLSRGCQRDRLQSVRGFFSYTTQRGMTPHNPASGLTMPRLGHRLPMCTLSPTEVCQLLSQPDLGTRDGIRDRSILELMYSTGVRRSELVGLRVFDVELERALLRVHGGKGHKDRVIPVGVSAVGWLAKYLDEVRPLFCVGREASSLYLTYAGAAMNADYLTHRVRRYIEAAGIEKPGSCHILRHTMATGMLDGGADIRFVQAMLGHASIDVTALYMHVSIEKLRAVHATTHPASRSSDVTTDRQV